MGAYDNGPLNIVATAEISQIFLHHSCTTDYSVLTGVVSTEAHTWSPRGILPARHVATL